MDKSISKGQDIENQNVIRRIDGDLEPTGGPRLVQRALRICLFSCYDPLKGSWLLSTGVDPHICATCTSYECMLPADACPVWLKAVTFTVPERLAKSKRSVRVLASYHISA